MEKIRELAWLRHGKDSVDVMPGKTPSFKFGNHGRVVCAATTQVQVLLDGTSGLINVAVHDVPGQPLLLSIRSLRCLGAVISYAKDEMIMTKVNPSKVLKLERAESGHQLFSMIDDAYGSTRHLAHPFVSLLTTE